MGRLPILLVALAAAWSGGCSSVPGRLWTSAGDDRWSDASPQFVHVGEDVTFRFESSWLPCDYVHFDWSDDGSVIDGRPSPWGGFDAEHRFTKVTDADDPIRIRAAGYIRHFRRDAMPVGGRLVRAGFADDPADLRFSVAEMMVYVYQSRIEVEAELGVDPDWDYVRLLIYPRDGIRVQVRAEREGRPGYFAVRVGADRWRLVYEPSGAEVNRSGATKAELRYFDSQGNEHGVKLSIRTP
ncbi:MAG: hypothetical protein V3T70_11390 [Phycisphaerae bacterium]